MLKFENNKIIMDENDYGLELPFNLSGDVNAKDKIVFIIKENLCLKQHILKKEYENCKYEDGVLSFNLSFTKEESELLHEGKYVYVLKQYRGESFLNTIKKDGIFEVEKGC